MSKIKMFGNTELPHSHEELKQISEDILLHAKKSGATEATALVKENGGLSLKVRKQKIDTIKHHLNKQISISIFCNNKSGSAQTSDFSRSSIERTVESAFNIARFTAENDDFQLPDEEHLEHNPPELDLYHPWDISISDAVKLATRAENATLSQDPRIINTDGANFGSESSHFILAMSNGFMGGYATSAHYLSCSALAEESGLKQMDGWSSSERRFTELQAPEAIGKLAANRALSRLNPRQVKTKKSPVLFDALLAKDIVGTVSTALNGMSLFSRTSFLIDGLGREIFPGNINLIENPRVRSSFGSAPFDGEGVKTRRRHIIRSGVVEEYFLSSYSAKKLGMKTTGNASGPHGLFVYSTLTKPEDDLASMLRKLGNGLYVTRLFGQGVNLVTGGFSRAAAGFWVEDGEIQYPVEGVTVAGNLQAMYSGIVAVGADRFNTGTFECGSLLVEQMSIGGI